MAKAKAMNEGYTPRLQELYEKEIRPAMQEKFNYKNPMEVPRLEKVVLNMGVGETVNDSKLINGAVSDMAQIAGQKPVMTRAKNSIAGFKLREDLAIGCKVTLRKQRMYEFMDRFVNTALPRVRDLRGLSPKSFDGRGNYSMGIKEQIVFPEINYDKVDTIRGMDIIIVTTAKTDEEARALLTLFNLPFIK